MVDLLTLYKNFSQEHEKFYSLGHKTPHNLNNISNQELIELFLYTYSFLGLNILEFTSLTKFRQLCEEQLNYIDNIGSPIKQYHKWWSLALIYLREGANFHSISFIVTVCNTLQDKIHLLKEKELVNYLNTINDSLSEIVGFDLRIRPHMDTNPKIYIYEIYRDLTINSEEIISVLNKYLDIRDVDNDDISHEFALIDNLGYNYHKWSVVFDILVGQMLTHNDNLSFSSNPKEHLSNILDISLLNLYINNDFIPENLTIVRKKIIKILYTTE